ncbi:LuxR family transcriptional regulator [Nocardioides sp. AN3]
MGSQPFVGRADELAFLHERHAEAGRGHPQTVLVEGPAGIGKSALLASFARSLDAPPLTASGDEAETFLDFGVLLQLLDSRAAAWSDPFAAGADLLRFLDRRHDRTTVFIVDDLQLCDADSMTALTFALRRLRADRVLAVLAGRDEGSGRVPPGLLRLVDAQSGRLPLRGLSEPEVVELGVARGCGQMSGRSATRLRRHTDGNPLYLGALIDELALDELDSPGPLPAPKSYAVLVLGALGSLSADAQALARAVAVLADGALVDVAAEVADVAVPATALDELTRTKLVTCTYADDGWRLGFLHPLVKAAVHDDLGPAERVLLHSRAAKLLHGEEALLHRVAAAPGPDPSVADELARSAAANRERGDLHRAAELFRTAARMSEPGAVGDQHLMDAIGLYLLAGDVTTTAALAERLDHVAPSAQRFHLQAKVAQLAGQTGEAEALALRAWERSEELEPDGRGPLAAILAQLCNMRGDGSAGAAWAERALSDALPPDLADSTSAAWAVGLTLAGQLPAALARLQHELPADPAAVRRDQHHQLCTRGVLRAAADDLAGARADLAALSVTSAGDLAPNRLLAMGVLAEVDFRLGSWDSSIALAAQALSLAEDTGQVWIQGFLHTAVVAVAASRGDWAEAEGHLNEARRLATELSDPGTLAVCENAGVHLAACRGDAEGVVSGSALLRSLPDGPTDEPGLLSWPVAFVSALVELGRLDEAATDIARFESRARDRGSRSRLAGLARVRGELATARREHAAARSAFEESLALGQDAATALELAVTDLSYGRFLRRRGERRAAVSRLEAARERSSALGALPFVERCDAELSACGAAPQPDRPSMPALTPQEQIVAGLVCQGLTNQQVAHRLVLSAKTVGYHLNNVYVKLDVHSRAQLIARLGVSR